MLNAWMMKAAHKLDPEVAHGLALTGLGSGLLPLPQPREYSSLRTRAFGFELPNPFGVAAGFDKNGEAFTELLRAGCGFVEVGTVTPEPQAGNPKPRLFRLKDDRAVINRLGFNNAGREALKRRLPPRLSLPGVVGVNIGKNKETVDALADYVNLLTAFYDRAVYFTVNISSPNTAGLRDLQQRENLQALLRGIMAERRGLAALANHTVPILVKIAPDLNDVELRDVVEVAGEEGIDGLIVGNTTLARPDSLRSTERKETGGLSGEPLFALSTERLQKTRELAGKEMLLIGVGGVSNGAQALAKIRAGADLVQFYSGLVYHGFPMIQGIKDEVAAHLHRDGVKQLSEVRG